MFQEINPNEMQEQILVVEENPGFHTHFQNNWESRVWEVKDMRCAWPLSFREFAVEEYMKTLPESDSSDEETVVRRSDRNRSN